MSRAQRLLDLIQLLRRNRRAVSGEVLARELGISLRTLYRDIATLQAQGAQIDGAPGLGYLMRAGFMLPPLMFTEDEIEALVLGSSWVSERSDSRLGAAARNAIAKIGAVLPPQLRHALESSALIVGPGAPLAAGDEELILIRHAIRHEQRLSICYRDLRDEQTERTIWPFALGFFDQARVVVAWCELRAAIRHFRTDRIVALHTTGQRYARRRVDLLKDWRREQGVRG